MTTSSSPGDAKYARGTKEQQTGDWGLNIPIPFIAAGITVAGAIGVAILAHKFSARREAIARTAAACVKFRGAIASVISGIPPADTYWDNKLLSTLPSLCTSIEIAVVEFRPFLASESRNRFDDEWKALKKHCEEQIPKALSDSEILYGGGPFVAKASKKQFSAHISNLLSFATET